MSQTKIIRGSEHVTIDTDTEVSVHCNELIAVIASLRALLSASPSITDINIVRTDPAGIFSYTVTTASPNREYKQTWYFDTPELYIEFNNPKGKWLIDELVANIKFREAVRAFNTAKQLQQFKVKLS